MSQAVVKEKPVPRGLPSATIVACLFLFGTTLIGGVWLTRQISDPAALPIRRVQIEGEFRYLDQQRLQMIVEKSVDAGFFGLDVVRVRDTLLDEPWIREATIRRVWPDTLRVSIEEQRPAARWGEHLVLNERGDVFAPAAETVPAGLIQLDGPVGLELEVLERYRDLRQRFAAAGLDITGLRLSARHAWTVVVREGQEIEFGRRDVDVRVARFLRAYAAGLASIWAGIQRVDLRYPNGLAVSQRARPGAQG